MRVRPFLRAAARAALLAVLMPAAAVAKPGDVLVLVPASSLANTSQKPGLVTDAKRAIADEALGALLAAHGLDDLDVLGPTPRAGKTAVPRLLRLHAPDAASAGAAVRDLLASGRVSAAMVDRELTLFATTPNDSMFELQWHLTGYPGSVHLPEAWDLAQGSASVLVGFIDTGIDIGHPDLAAHVWTNPLEIPANNIDDDGNGYIDDVHGWDFGDNDNDPNPTPLFDELGIDNGFHGTATAATACAVTNNLIGIAGTSWTSSLVPMRAADSTGVFDASYAGEAMLYAADLGVDVLNMSFGAANPDSETTAFFQDLVDACVANDVLCVASAGNDGSSVPAVPAGCDGVLAVGSIGETNVRSDFSNYGPWVDLAAPGEAIWVAINRNYVFDDVSQVIYEFFFGWDGIQPYMYADGTSFSAPIVAGIAALVRAKAPAAPASVVAAHLIRTGDAVTYDQPIGKKINAYQAVLTPVAAPDVRDAGTGTHLMLAAAPTPFRTSTTLTFVLPQTGRARLSIIAANGRAVRTLVDGEMAAGPRNVTWDGRDAAGRTAPAGLYFGVLEGPDGRATARLVRLD